MMDFADKVFIGSYDGFPSEGPMLKGSDSAIALRVNSQLQLPVAFLVLAYRSRADFADAASDHAHRAIRDRPALLGDGPAEISNVRWNRRRAGSCGMSRPAIARAACSMQCAPPTKQLLPYLE
jgi:hypothetical protein